MKLLLFQFYFTLRDDLDYLDGKHAVSLLIPVISWFLFLFVPVMNKGMFNFMILFWLVIYFCDVMDSFTWIEDVDIVVTSPS